MAHETMTKDQDPHTPAGPPPDTQGSAGSPGTREEPHPSGELGEGSEQQGSDPKSNPSLSQGPQTTQGVGTPDSEPSYFSFTRSVPMVARAFPFLMSALFFLSAVFLIFSPLPLLIFASRVSRPRFVLALLANTVVVAIVGEWIHSRGGGLVLAGFYGVFSASLAFWLYTFLVDKRYSLEKTALLTLLSVIGLATGILLGFNWITGINPIVEFQVAVNQMIDEAVQISGLTFNEAELPPEVIKQQMWQIVPANLVIYLIIMIWANLVLLLRMNPLLIRQRLGIESSFLKDWKAPEWLVWPTIGAGGIYLLLEAGTTASSVAFGSFYVLLAIYALQGISVLSFLFDTWKLGAFLRAALLVMVLLFMRPLLVGIGFFDLWFDFRSKMNKGR